MLDLSDYRRDRLRALGVEADLPVVTVFRDTMSRDPGFVSNTHLSAGCYGTGPYDRVEAVSALDLHVPGWCSGCTSSPLYPVVGEASGQLQALDDFVEAIGMAELTEVNNRTSATPSPSALGDALIDCDRMLHVSLASLGDESCTSAAVPVLRDRLEGVRSRIVDLLRSGPARRQLVERLVMERMILSRGGGALLAETVGLTGLGVAAVYGFGVEVVPGRFLVTGSLEAIGVLNYRARSVLLPPVTGLEAEVLRTAAVLWDPLSDGPLSRGDTLVEAARLLTPASSLNS